MDWVISRRTNSKPITFNRKPPLKTRGLFLIQVSELLEEGFSMGESLDFLSLSMNKLKGQIQDIQSRLNQGQGLDQAFLSLGLSSMQRGQIKLALETGSLAKTCRVLGQWCLDMDKQEHKLRQALIYPVFLLIFLLGMVLTMRTFLLSQLVDMVQEEVLVTMPMLHLIWEGFLHLPQIALWIGIFLLVGGLILGIIWYRMKALSRLKSLLGLPLLGKILRKYFSALYARQFSYFLAGGHSLKQMVAQLLDYPAKSLTWEIAQVLNRCLNQGQSFDQALGQVGIFTQEMIHLVMQGDQTRATDQKLHRYALLADQTVLEDMERSISFIQPILFLFIGLTIIVIYLILLLPTFTLMEGLEI